MLLYGLGSLNEYPSHSAKKSTFIITLLLFKTCFELQHFYLSSNMCNNIILV